MSMVVLVFVVAVLCIAVPVRVVSTLATIFAVNKVRVYCSIGWYALDCQERVKIGDLPFVRVRRSGAGELVGVDIFYYV